MDGRADGRDQSSERKGWEAQTNFQVMPTCRDEESVPDGIDREEVGRTNPSEGLAILLKAPTERSRELPLLHVGHWSTTWAVTLAPSETRVISMNFQPT